MNLQSSTAGKTAADFELREPKPAPFTPEFIRIPVGQKCPFTGLSRAKLYQLISPSAGNGFRPVVKSISLRTPGAAKGVRLIHYPSLLAYLHSFAEESASARPSGAPFGPHLPPVAKGETSRMVRQHSA